MLIESHRYLGDLLARSSDPERAAEHYRRQLALNEEMVAADPASAQFRSNLSTALVKAGDTRARANDAGAALRYYRRALRIREGLAKSDAAVSVRRDLAAAHVKVGEALEATGARAEALAHYADAVRTFDALSASAPAHVGVRVMLGEACAKVGGTHAALAAASATNRGREHWREARVWYRRGLEVWLELRARGADFHGRLTSPADPVETASAEIAKCEAALSVKK
jgi:tetratricopeptide (TPR) repeat protein